MTKSRTIFLSVSAAALLGASGLCAQTQATANIPFAFSAQNTVLPAGEYTMSNASATGVMWIRNAETRQTIAVLARSLSDYKRGPEKNVVVFHRIGDRYFLAEVNTAAVKGQLGPSKLERELTSEGGGQPMAAVIIPALNVR